jgi:hypothetical protein
MTEVSNLAGFRALDPFFRVIEEGVAGLADGEQHRPSRKPVPASASRQRLARVT